MHRAVSKHSVSRLIRERNFHSFNDFNTRFCAVSLWNTHNSSSQVFCRPCQALSYPCRSNITSVSVHKKMFANFDILNLFVQLLTAYLVILTILS